MLPELLMPAGDLFKAYTAFRYGADAIYCGCAMFSLRTRENKITENDIAEIIDFARKNDKKVYVTVNAFPHQPLIKALEKHLQFLETVKPDGIIFADLGVLTLADEHAPSVPKHLSVQTSTVNIPAIKMWQKLGVSRIILAREMSVREAATIHKHVPEMELEYFVHGAVCMAYSGRCLLSSFTGGRDANCGSCNHTCRWNYRVFDEDGREVDVSPQETPTPYQGLSSDEKKSAENCSAEKQAKGLHDFEQVNFAEEEQRPGEIIPIEEDFHGTHIMSSKDMCMIEALAEIREAGICSLKVEGRNKTAYYVATIARAYRQALDDLKAKKPFDEHLWREVYATANRGFFPGFLHGKPREGSMQYNANRSTSEKEFSAIIESVESDGKIKITVKNRIKKNAELELVMPHMEDDIIFSAESLWFGEKEVAILHPGDTNKAAKIKPSVDMSDYNLNNIFIRQKTQDDMFL